MSNSSSDEESAIVKRKSSQEDEGNGSESSENHENVLTETYWIKTQIVRLTLNFYRKKVEHFMIGSRKIYVVCLQGQKSCCIPYIRMILSNFVNFCNIVFQNLKN